MCNLSYGIYKKGIIQGTNTTIVKALKNGIPIGMACLIFQKNEQELEDIVHEVTRKEERSQ